MVLVLVFVLARNIVKLFVERRRGLPFSRFRAKLVLAMLGLTIVPSVLVLLVGGELIRSSTQLWFSQPVDEVLRSANEIGGNYYREHEALVAIESQRIARGLSARAVESGNLEAVRAAIAPEVTRGRLGLVEVYRLTADGVPSPLVAVESPSLPRGHTRGTADRLAVGASGSGAAQASDSLDAVAASCCARGVPRPLSRHEPGGRRGDRERILVGATSPSMPAASRKPTKTTASSGCFAALQGVYLSIFLMMTLRILVGADMDRLYLAKRHPSGATARQRAPREIGAGRLDHRIETEDTGRIWIAP